MTWELFYKIVAIGWVVHTIAETIAFAWLGYADYAKIKTAASSEKLDPEEDE